MKQERTWLRATRIAAGVVGALLVVLTATGIVLTFRYRPDISSAYADAAGLTRRSRLSARSVHQVASALFLPAAGALAIASIGLFFVRRDRAPIALSILAGVGALVATITGFVLPWDQLGLRAVKVGTDIHGYTPILDHSHEVTYVLIGARTTAVGTFARVYWLHAVVVPVAIAALVIALVITTRRRPRLRGESEE